jgi:prolyl oligopeptidase
LIGFFFCYSMKNALLGILLLASPASFAQSAPPTAPKGPATDVYCGTSITDPYRNLENLTDPAVQTWKKAQADYARQTLNAIPGRQGLLDKMNEFDARKAEQVRSLKIADNDRYFYLKIRPQDQQPKLYCRDGYKGTEVLLFDPEAFETGKVYTINSFSPS